MGLTPEQKIERDNSLKNLEITTAEAYSKKQGYIFVSYKSDNWKKVFEEKVFALQRKGVRIYSDKNFDDENSPWLDSMDRNMNFCTAVMIFISKEYMTSMATFIEILTAIKYYKPIIPVYIQDKYTLNNIIMENALELKEYVEAKDNEISKLQELLKKDNYDGEFNDEIKQIRRDLSKNIKERKLTKENIKNAFSKILDSGKLQDNEFSKPLDSLLNTIRSAYKQAQAVQAVKIGLYAYCPIADDKTEEANDKMSSKLEKHNEEISVEKNIQNEDKDESNKASEKTNSKHVAVNVKKDGVESVPVIENYKTSITKSMTLAEFAQLFENDEFVYYLRNLRASGGKKYNKQMFDYTMAALLRGCDIKLQEKEPRWKYCVYDVASKVDLENPVLGCSQFTWQSNSRKAVNISGSGKLGENSEIFAGNSKEATIGEIERKFINQEKGYITKDNNQIENVFLALYQ